jgi:hypothetical protein
MTDDTKPDLNRRHLGLGLFALLGGSLAAKTAAAFEPAAQGNFNAASQVLKRYGVKVVGDSSSGHDVLSFETAPQPGIEYAQVVGERGAFGEIIPCVKTAVNGDDASFTHFHASDTGEIVPCIKTRIEGHSFGVTEIFDAEQGGVEPCFRVEAEMLEGAHIGTITATHFHPADQGWIIPCVRTTIEGHSLATYELLESNEKGGATTSLAVVTQMLDGGVLGSTVVTVDNPNLPLALRVGDKTYNLVNGELVLAGPR